MLALPVSTKTFSGPLTSDARIPGHHVRTVKEPRTSRSTAASSSLAISMLTDDDKYTDISRVNAGSNDRIQIIVTDRSHLICMKRKKLRTNREFKIKKTRDLHRYYCALLVFRVFVWAR